LYCLALYCLALYCLALCCLVGFYLAGFYLVGFYVVGLVTHLARHRTALLRRPKGHSTRMVQRTQPMVQSRLCIHAKRRLSWNGRKCETPPSDFSRYRTLIGRLTVAQPRR